MTASAAIDAIPNEVLARIFSLAVHCIEYDYYQDSSAQAFPGKAALSITYVSSRWRSIALSTGELWTDIILTFPTSHAQTLRAIIWLSRSGRYPVDIFLDFRDPRWDWEESSHSFTLEDMKVVMDLLLPHVWRWRSFELFTDTWAPIYAFLASTQRVKAAPELQTLRLTRCNAYFASRGQEFLPAELKDPIPLFGGRSLPALREVCLGGVHVDWTRSCLQNLTTFELKYHAQEVLPSLKDFQRILASSPRLQQLTILGWGPQFSQHEAHVSRESIHLPPLTRFSFGYIHLPYSIQLLSLFRFQSIQHLSLEDVLKTVEHTFYIDAQPIIQCLLAKVPLFSVSQLSLQDLHAMTDAMRPFFRKLTALEHISLLKVDPFVLQGLQPEFASDAAPCPALHQITFRGDQLHLERLKRARKAAGYPISEVSVLN